MARRRPWQAAKVKRPRRRRPASTDWGTLNDFAIKALMRSPVPYTTLLRSMGVPLPPLLVNPSGKGSTMASAPHSEQLPLFGGRRGPQNYSIKSGRPRRMRAAKATDMRTRRRVWVHPETGQPIVSRADWEKFYRPPRPRRGQRKAVHVKRRKIGKMPAALARYWRERNRSEHAKKRRGRKKGRHHSKAAARRRSTRMPSKGALRSFVRGLPRKAELRVFRDVRKGKSLRSYTLRNPRSEDMATYTNPHRRRRRRNPGMAGGAVQALTHAAIPGAIGGAAAALIDSTVLSGRPMIMRVGAKVLLAGLGGALLRKNPTRTAALVGSLVGTAAYEGTVRTFGGLVAGSRPAGMKELAAMAAEDEASLGMLQEELRGMGLLEEDHAQGISDMGEEPNLGDEELQGIADIEPNLGDEYTE